MKNRIVSICAMAGIFAILIALDSGVPHANAQTGPGTPSAAGIVRTAALLASSQDGLPSGMDQAKWNRAFGAALVRAGSAGTDSIDLEFAGLIPNGMYSAWWANTMPALTMGALASSNSFTADAHGNASMAVEVPSNSSYQQIDVIYQANGKAPGADSPGKMGSEVFTQLTGDFPSASAMAATAQAAAASGGGAATKATVLLGVSFNGVPKAADPALWPKQIGMAAVTGSSGGMDSIDLRLGRLIPNGLYTAWWTNTTPSRGTGILPKVPGEPIMADADGWASLSFDVPSDNNYQRLGVFFQADNKMPGTDTPGTMGSVAYIALIGGFPGPAGLTAPVNPRPARATQAATPAK